MDKKIEDALNQQVRIEFEAAFLYLAFSMDLQRHGLPGSAHWMLKQYHEECGHALHLMEYLQKRGACAVAPQVERPRYEWESPADLFRLALAHEKLVTESIYAIVALAREVRDYATEGVLFEYVREQVEEETSAGDIVQTLSLCGGSVDALLSLDGRLAQR